MDEGGTYRPDEPAVLFHGTTQVFAGKTLKEGFRRFDPFATESRDGRCNFDGILNISTTLATSEARKIRMAPGDVRS